ncbi:MAG: DNA mismatch repair protein MutS [Clostridiales bacterium]|nr:DNA mismatch repair protein MutS [Clostridiales bacterium]
MSKAEKFYKENIEESNKKIEELNRIIAKIGWSRLIILLLGLFISWKLYSSSGVYNAIIAIIITIVVFIIVANIHGKKMKIKENLEITVEVNEKGLKRLNGKYREFEDKGEDLVEEGHPFCNDLDIFGQNSLFQMINTTRTKKGRKRLGEILSINKLPSKEEVLLKQKAIKELGDKVKWRQKLYIDSTFKKNKGEELESLIKWCTNKSNNGIIKLVIASIFIGITMIGIFLMLLNIIPFSILILDLMINYVAVKVLTKDKDDAINLFHSVKYSVKAYANILSLIEDENFQSEYLNKLKNKLNNNSNVSCKKEMGKLSSLLDWVGDSSANAYFFLLNIFAFADVFIIYNLNKWKSENGNKVENWLDVMAEFDALSSIANLSFDNENWAYASISDNMEVIGEKIAHPLIGERAVANDYELSKPKQITLITGSNMSGKSTFLRSVGINIILAYIGAPSCAKSFKCGIMNVYTCMRTKDNLEESISSFYAEILRIKLIMEACKKGEKIFFLLDEIFKGTNSKDRHTGATVLIKQLIDCGVIGLLSTHDLELCDLEKEMTEVENYNFREYYEDNKIKFDYKLRKGKSTTQNAVYLMKLAGIDI